MEIKQLPKKEIKLIKSLIEKMSIDRAKKYDKLLKTNKKCAVANFNLIKKQINKNKSAIFIAINGPKIIGYAFGTIEKLPEVRFKVARIGHIWDVFVEASHRNKRIGSALIKKLLSWFKEQNTKYVRIGAFFGNPSLKLYKQLGFKERHTNLQMRLK